MQVTVPVPFWPYLSPHKMTGLARIAGASKWEVVDLENVIRCACQSSASVFLILSISFSYLSRFPLILINGGSEAESQKLLKVSRS